MKALFLFGIIALACIFLARSLFQQFRESGCAGCPGCKGACEMHKYEKNHLTKNSGEC